MVVIIMVGGVLTLSLMTFNPVLGILTFVGAIVAMVATARSQPSKTNCPAAVARPTLTMTDKPPKSESFRRCDRCGYWGPRSSTRCPNCHHIFSSAQSSEKSALPKAGLFTLPPEKRKTCPKCDMIVASWANHCPACQHSFVQVRSPGSVAEPSGPPDAPTPSGNTKPPIAVVEQIRLLGELRDDGLLTEDEFQAKKTELLSRI